MYEPPPRGAFRPHEHPEEELTSAAGLSRDEWLLHMSEYHHMLMGAVGRTPESLSRLHAAEHKGR
jgi:hypothetical protein